MNWERWDEPWSVLVGQVWIFQAGGGVCCIPAASGAAGVAGSTPGACHALGTVGLAATAPASSLAGEAAHTRQQRLHARGRRSKNGEEKNRIRKKGKKGTKRELFNCITIFPS